MNLFIGTKLIKSLAMNHADYNTYRGWTLPADEDGRDQGYLVEYIDGGGSNHPKHEGYISWSPQNVFENAYKDTAKGVSFGGAIELIEQGYKVARAGWNGKGMFIYYVPAASYPPKTQAAHDAFNGKDVPYGAYMAIKTTQNIVNTWVPSVSDVLAKDWVLVTL